jgi:hypothetical protein
LTGTFALAGQTDMAVNLKQGIYIVQSGSHAAKLFVNTCGTGSAVEQTVTSKATTYSSPAPPSVTTRAAAVFKTWMNIVHGNSGTLKTPIQMDLVQYWKFTPVSDLEFVMKDGNVIKIAGYKSIDFDIEPVPAQTNGWDMEKTLKFGGASYGLVSKKSDNKITSIYIAIVHSKGVILFDNDNQKITQYPIESIHNDVWTYYFQYKNVLTFWDVEISGGYVLKDMGAAISVNNIFAMVASSDGRRIGMAKTDFFNEDAEIMIPSSITLNPDGTVTMNAGSVSHTFTGW